MTSCVTSCDEAKWVRTCVHESACVHVCFCMTSVGAFPFPCHQLKAKAASRPCFLPLSYKYKISFEEAVITADAAKNLKSVLHTTTHNSSISRHIIPGTKTMIFSPEKVVLMTPNERAAVWVTPQNSLLATPSCWVSEVYYREPSHPVSYVKTNLDKCWFTYQNSEHDFIQLKATVTYSTHY